MNEYVSLQKIVTLFEQYQQSQQGIGLNGFGYGNIVDFGLDLTGGTQTSYPFMFVTPINVSYDENITTYTISIIFADRINDDKFNLVDVQSDMSIQAKRFISWIKRGMNQNPNLYDNMEINLPVTGIPFMERFNDYVGGIAIDAEVIVFEDINACDYYDFSVSPTPTPTPTVTPSPTATPTATPTITPTPSETSGICSLYQLGAGSSGSNFTWVNCDGTPGSIYLSGNSSTEVCGKFGTFSYDGGGLVISVGLCPTLTPTPSITPTTTPTVTPTPTSSALPVSPTATPTKTPTPTPTPTPAACKTYKVTYGPQKVGGTEPSFTYTDCSTGLGTTIVVDRFNVGAVYNVCVKRVNNNYAISTGACNCDANFTFEQLGNC
jgi:hypothetical protein